MSSIDKFYSVFEKQKLERILNNILKKKTDNTWGSHSMTLVSSILVSYGCFEKYLEFNTETTQVPLVVILLGLSAALVGLVSAWLGYKNFVKWSENKNTNDEKRIEEVFNSEIAHEHNYVFLIKRDGETRNSILFLKKPKWGYVLPYIKSNEEMNTNDLSERFSKKIGGVKLKIKIMDETSLKNVIKKKPDEGYTKISYTFCHCDLFIDYHKFSMLLGANGDASQYRFLTLDDVKDDLSTMKTNSDIINHLNEVNLFDTEDSFEQNSEIIIPSDLKVIWNITDQCSFDCEFCATKSNTDKKDELDFYQRVQIAEELKKIENLHLDFAGGDPLYDPESRNAISHISKYMIDKGICVTSTGVGLGAINTIDIFKYCREFDVSYDYPSSWDNKHRTNLYNKLNFKQIKELINSGAKVNILTTLSAHNCKPDIIDAMIKELKTVNPHSITLLRLMPVGKQSYEKYPVSEDYNPLESIRLFKGEFGELVKLHCAFRAYMPDEKNNCCNMLQEKVGVDNMGNMYSCAWAAYLPEKGTDNPFYLGNLLHEGGIENIFKSARYGNLKKVCESNENNFCKIISYRESSKDGLTKNKDKFYVSYEAE